MVMAPDRGLAVVTGATSALAKLYADRLARRGFDLMLVARDARPCRQRARRLAGATGRAVSVLSADLNQRSDLRRVEQILRAQTRITLLINGPESRVALEGAGDSEAIDDHATFSALAMTRLAYAVSPGLIARGGGAVVNIAAEPVCAPRLVETIDVATRAFVLAFSRSLQSQLGDRGVVVQAVAPGLGGGFLCDDDFHAPWRGGRCRVMSDDQLVEHALDALEDQWAFGDGRAGSGERPWSAMDGDGLGPWRLWRDARRARRAAGPDNF